MKNDDKASISLKKIICITMILIFFLGIGVMAGNAKVNNVKIILASGYEMNVLTTKTTVKEILDENHIILLEDEKVTPKEDEELSDNKTITIMKNTEEVVAVSSEIETSENITAENVLEQNYAKIIEKIVKEKVKIPYETITKDVSTGSGTKQNSVVQNGVDGEKEVTYKVKYQNDEEIERVEISSKVIKKPVDKIIEVRTRQVTSRGSSRTATSNPAKTASTTLAKKVENITPQVVTFNTSAYCPCISCCGKTNGITASGAKASAWYTVAAGSAYPIGTVIYIPYFKNEPNGGWFVVQDRGGAISSSKLDIFMNTHGEALQFGRRNLECYVYEF